MIRGAAAVLLLTALTCLPAGASAQCLPASPDVEDPCPLDAPSWVGHFTTLSANAVLGGLTAGVIQHLRDGSFARGFARGVLGGGVVYGGKWVAAQRFSGAGLVGREVAAVGTSVVRNAADGVGWLDRLVLPLGPVRLYVSPRDGWRTRARLDAFAAGWTIYGVAEGELSLDAGASLSAGAPVFRTKGKIMKLDGDDAHAAGLTNAGVVFLADVPGYGSAFTRRSLAHERVHVIQSDQLFLWWTDPVEDWVLAMLPGGERLARHVDVDLSTELLRWAGTLFPQHGDRPWELESRFLAR